MKANHVLDARDIRRSAAAIRPSQNQFVEGVVLPAVAILFALGIFIVDTFTSLGIAVAALYAVVVLMAGRFLERRGVLLVAGTCIALTLASYLFQHWGTYGGALVRCIVSLVAIVITTFLALKSQTASLKLREQASLLEITHDAVIARDLDDRISYWNRGAEELYGWPREEAIGKSPHELLQTEFPAARETLEAALLSADRLEVELVHTKRDRTKVVVASRWSVQRDSSGRPVAILETNNDITKHKQAEAALRRSEANLADAQKLSKTGSFAWEVASGKIAWSEEAFRIFECDPSIAPTLDLVIERTHPDDRGFLGRLLDRVSRNRQDWEVEHRLMMPDGSVKHVHVVARAAGEDELEYIGALRDVTSNRKAQDALQRAQADLAHVTRVTTLGELTASIAHEVNQPLAAIVTNGEASLRWLGLVPPDIGETRGAVSRIISDSHRASEVIKRLRELARKSDPKMAPLDINDVIRDVAALVQGEVRRHRVKLRLDLADALSPVTGDRVQLQQVLINLMMNGIEAMVLSEMPRELFVRSVTYEKSRALVAVQDTGIGIDPEQLDDLFQAFFTTKPNGMGMGLSICRSIIEAHDGELWALPNEGSGATFQFTVRLHAEPAT